jgi:NDP-sugar pyrophosphorylase family protein
VSETEVLNIVIPMAGRGSRFAKVGYDLPKPLIPVHGVPMIECVIRNLAPSRPHRFLFLCLDEHLESYGLGERLVAWTPGCIVIPVREVTEGAACTVLLAREHIDTAAPLMIANCDQWVDISIDAYLDAMGGHDGLIMTMWGDHPKWSFVRRDASGRVVGVVEKEVVSNEATVGIYNFRRGADFVRAAEAMIAKNFRVNGEFYVAPAYDALIAGGGSVGTFDIGEGMHGIGTPEDLAVFLAHPRSRAVVVPEDDAT